MLVCPPLGHGYHETYSSLRLLSERLAQAGCASLRMDYEGTGDSAGDQREPDRVSAWVRSILNGIAFLREATSAPIVVVGMRLGATMAALATETVAIDGLVMWDPVSSGRSYVSEQKALFAISVDRIAASEDGLVHMPEMVMSADAAAELRDVDITRSGASLASRALVLTRRATGPGKLGPRLRMAHVEWAEATDQEDLMEAGSAYGVIAYATVERIVDWVSTPHATRPVAFRPAPTSPLAEISLGDGGGYVVEQPLNLGKTGLFGVLTEPAMRNGGPTVVFVNTANGTHVGGARLWVELARRWAGLGLRCFRMDLSGLGDSPVRHEGQARYVSAMPEAIDDVLEACLALEATDPSNVVLVGHCTGGYQVLESALDLRPRGVVSINPLMSFPPPERMAGRRLDPRRRILLPRRGLARKYYTAHYQQATPSGVLHRYVNMGRVIRSIAAPKSKAASWARELERQVVNDIGWRVKMLLKPTRRPLYWLGKLIEGGTDVVLVTCELDARPLRIGIPAGTFEKWEQEGLCRIHISDHMLRIPQERRDVVDAITGHLAQRFKPDDGPDDDKLLVQAP